MQELCPTRTIELGLAWAGNSVNAVAPRAHGIFSCAGECYVAFYEPDGAIAVESLALDGSARRRQRLTGGPRPTDAHVAISLGLDAEGILHLAWGAHSSRLFTCHARGSDIEDGFVDPYVLTGPYDAEITYPTFVQLKAGLDPLFLYREGSALAGAIRMKRLDRTTRVWCDDSEALLDGRSGQSWTAGPYLDTPMIGANGRIDLTYCWRLTPAASDAGLVGNVGIDYLRSYDALRTLHSETGVRLNKPITPASTQRVIPIPLGRGLLNQCSSMLRQDGVPVTATIWSEEDQVPQYRLVWADSPSWHSSTISAFTTPFRLDGQGTLPLPHSRPKLLIDRRGFCFVVFRSQEFANKLCVTILAPPHYRREESTSLTLMKEDLGFYEPIVDAGAWTETGDLVCYVQQCEQRRNEDHGQQREDMVDKSARARVLVWSAQAIQDSVRTLAGP